VAEAVALVAVASVAADMSAPWAVVVVVVIEYYISNYKKAIP